jgi:branched-chain amino acid aminotransferase
MSYFNSETIIYHNGTFQKATDAYTNLYSQTLHYGYGVFEGIRAYNTENGARIFKAKEHYERLIQSCSLMSIPFNYTADAMTELTYELLKQNNFTDAYIRPLVYCGPNMSLTKGQESHLLICAWEWGAYLGDKQLNLKISSYCRPHPRSIQTDAKVCGHYVNSILAVTEAKEQGYDEALLLDHESYLAEGPGANLYFEKDGKLFTPKSGNILKGITRSVVMDIAKGMGIETEEGNYLPEQLYNADSAFYCGTGAEIVGIASVDGKPMKTAWENSIGKKIQREYLDLVREKNVVSKHNKPA